MKKSKDKEPVWWFHWQNLNEDRITRQKGSALKHGRAWLRLGRTTFMFSWNLWTHFCHIEALVGGPENDLTLSIALPPVAFWFSIEGLIPYSKMPKALQYGGRSSGIRIFDKALWVELWQDTHSWKKGDWRFSFHPLDFFLGSSKYSFTDIDSQNVVIPMPEGTYQGKIALKECIWKRPRSLFKTKIIRAEIEVENPPMFRGKGENSWDCGDDCIYSMTTPCNSIEKAIGLYVAEVLSLRKKRGWSYNLSAAGQEK